MATPDLFGLTEFSKDFDKKFCLMSESLQLVANDLRSLAPMVMAKMDPTDANVFFGAIVKIANLAVYNKSSKIESESVDSSSNDDHAIAEFSCERAKNFRADKRILGAINENVSSKSINRAPVVNNKPQFAMRGKAVKKMPSPRKVKNRKPPKWVIPKGDTKEGSLRSLVLKGEESLESPCRKCGSPYHAALFCNRNNQRAKYLMAIEANVCLVCLKKDHTTNECGAKYVCFICGARHSSFLCHHHKPSREGVGLARNKSDAQIARPPEQLNALIKDRNELLAIDFIANDLMWLKGYLDTGATINAIPSHVARASGFKTFPVRGRVSTQNGELKVTEGVKIRVTIGTIKNEVTFFLIDRSDMIILGLGIFKLFRIVLDSDLKVYQRPLNGAGLFCMAELNTVPTTVSTSEPLESLCDSKFDDMSLPNKSLDSATDLFCCTCFSLFNFVPSKDKIIFEKGDNVPSLMLDDFAFDLSEFHLNGDHMPNWKLPLMLHLKRGKPVSAQSVFDNFDQLVGFKPNLLMGKSSTNCPVLVFPKTVQNKLAKDVISDWIPHLANQSSSDSAWVPTLRIDSSSNSVHWNLSPKSYETFSLITPDRNLFRIFEHPPVHLTLDVLAKQLCRTTFVAWYLRERAKDLPTRVSPFDIGLFVTLIEQFKANQFEHNILASDKHFEREPIYHLVPKVTGMFKGYMVEVVTNLSNGLNAHNRRLDDCLNHLGGHLIKLGTINCLTATGIELDSHQHEIDPNIAIVDRPNAVQSVPPPTASIFDDCSNKESTFPSVGSGAYDTVLSAKVLRNLPCMKCDSSYRTSFYCDGDSLLSRYSTTKDAGICLACLEFTHTTEYNVTKYRCSICGSYHLFVTCNRFSELQSVDLCSDQRVLKQQDLCMSQVSDTCSDPYLANSTVQSGNPSTQCDSSYSFADKCAHTTDSCLVNHLSLVPPSILIEPVSSSGSQAQATFSENHLVSGKCAEPKFHLMESMRVDSMPDLSGHRNQEFESFHPKAPIGLINQPLNKADCPPNRSIQHQQLGGLKHCASAYLANCAAKPFLDPKTKPTLLSNRVDWQTIAICFIVYWSSAYLTISGFSSSSLSAPKVLTVGLDESLSGKFASNYFPITSE